MSMIILVIMVCDIMHWMFHFFISVVVLRRNRARQAASMQVRPPSLEFDRKRTSRGDVPLSPTHYQQPPTPDFPPPSPHTAVLGIQLQINPWVSNLKGFYWLKYFANTEWCKRPEKWPKPWHMGTHPMNTNMTGFRWFSKIFASQCFGRK